MKPEPVTEQERRLLWHGTELVAMICWDCANRGGPEDAIYSFEPGLKFDSAKNYACPRCHNLNCSMTVGIREKRA